MSLYMKTVLAEERLERIGETGNGRPTMHSLFLKSRFLTLDIGHACSEPASSLGFLGGREGKRSIPLASPLLFMDFGYRGPGFEDLYRGTALICIIN